MLKTTIYITAEEMAALDATARREDRSKAAVIRDAIGKYVVEPNQLMPEAVGIFEDTEVDSTNIDEWLAENWIID